MNLWSSRISRYLSRSADASLDITLEFGWADSTGGVTVEAVMSMLSSHIRRCRSLSVDAEYVAQIARVLPLRGPCDRLIRLACRVHMLGPVQLHRYLRHRLFLITPNEAPMLQHFELTSLFDIFEVPDVPSTSLRSVSLGGTNWSNEAVIEFVKHNTAITTLELFTMKSSPFPLLHPPFPAPTVKSLKITDPFLSFHQSMSLPSLESLTVIGRVVTVENSDRYDPPSFTVPVLAPQRFSRLISMTLSSMHMEYVPLRPFLLANPQILAMAMDSCHDHAVLILLLLGALPEDFAMGKNEVFERNDNLLPSLLDLQIIFSSGPRWRDGISALVAELLDRRPNLYIYTDAWSFSESKLTKYPLKPAHKSRLRVVGGN